MYVSIHGAICSEPVGKYFIQLCGTTPCMINGSEEIKQVIMDELDIKDGETTSDGLFTLLGRFIHTHISRMTVSRM